MSHTLHRSSSSCCFSGDSGCSSTNFNTVCRMNRLLNIMLPTAPAVPPPRRRPGRVGRGGGAAGAGRGCCRGVAYLVGTPPPDGSESSLGLSIWTWVWANWLTASFGLTRPVVGLFFLPRSTVQLFEAVFPPSFNRLMMRVFFDQSGLSLCVPVVLLMSFTYFFAPL